VCYGFLADTPYPYREESSMSTTEKSFAVEGMTCGHCELSVREEVEELDGVESAQANRATGQLVVRGEQIDDHAVRDAVEAAGYQVAA
jgi:copper chaperone CopZ